VRHAKLASAGGGTFQPCARHIAWARRLRTRYTGAELRRPVLAMVFQRRLAARGIHYRIDGARFQMNLCPRVGVTLMAATPTPLSTQISTVVTPATHRTDRFFHTAQRLLQTVRETARTGSSASAQSLIPSPTPAIAHSAISRVFSSFNRRFEQIHQLVRTWSQATESITFSKELPNRLRERAVRRERPIQDAPKLVAAVPQTPNPSPTFESVPNSGSFTTRPSVPLAPQTFAPAAPINVDAITTQVIQQLDRRLVAYRERMGRV
jgi:hypothetical protein